MEINWTDRVRNEVLHSVKEERNIVHTVKRRKGNCIGNIMRRKCLLKHVIEGKVEERIEETRRRRLRSKQLFEYTRIKETTGYWKLKETALDRTLENSLWKRLGSCREKDCIMNVINFYHAK